VTQKPYDGLAWLTDEETITLVNTTQHNFILDLPAGHYRLDAGRRMRTLRSILKFDQVKQLVDQGDIRVEKG
jgi:hypothetical protein